jgi:hypothetical protein
MLPPVTRVVLTDEDRALAHAFFLLMRAVKPNVRRTVLNARDREDYETAGKLGEIGFGRAMGLPVDWTVSAQRADGGIDFVLRDGRTVDVVGLGAGEPGPRLQADVWRWGVSRRRRGLGARGAGARGWRWPGGDARDFRGVGRGTRVGHRGAVCPRVMQRSQMHDWRAVVGGWVLDDEEVA